MPSKQKKLTEPAEPKYQDFIKGVALVNLGLNSCACELDRRSYFAALEGKGRVATNVTAEYALMNSGKDFFSSAAKFRLEVSDPSEKRALNIECVFEAHFHVRERVNVDHARRFASSEARIVLWPYFRQFVSDATARMTIPPITLPLATEPKGD